MQGFRLASFLLFQNDNLERECLFAEFFLEDYADALGVQGGAGEVSVVALVINLQGDGSFGGEDVLQAEVADEVLGVLHDVVSVAELPVEDKRCR